MGEAPARLRARANYWIEADGEVVLSEWRVRLLETVDRLGSLNKAADELGAPYRLLWSRLNRMEAALGERLVERHVGGPEGGGTTLTPAGREYVARFRRFAAGLDAVVEAHFRAAFGE